MGAEQRSEPWRGALEATIFSGWIYDTLKPFATELQVGHPAMMRAIGASKKKSDRLDAHKIANLVRCDLLPACYMAPVEIRELRRLLRYRNLMVAQAVRLKNKMSGLLMEAGAEYDKQRLHGKEYFNALLDRVEEVPESVKELLRLSRSSLETFEGVQQQLLARLRKEPLLAGRVKRLTSIRGVGEVTGLTWALEVGEPGRFPSIGDAVSYCGLTSALVSSADKQAAWANLETAQCAPADGIGGSGKSCATLEPAIIGSSPAGVSAGRPQPGDTGGCTKAGSVSAGGRQVRQGFRSSCTEDRNSGGPDRADSTIKTRSELTSGIDVYVTGAARPHCRE